MSKLKLTACAALITGTLSGCVGSGEFGGVEDHNRFASTPQTSAAEMPNVGTATYSGRAGLDVMDNDIGDLDGDLALIADFSRGSVGGTISSLKGDVGSFNGELTIENGAIKNNTFAGNLNGEISRYAPEKQYPVGVVFGDSNRVSGVFRDDYADVVTGSFSGQATHFEGSGTDYPRFEGAVDVKGGFSASQ